MEMQGLSRLMRDVASFAGHVLHFTPWGHHPFGQAVAVQLLARGPRCGQQGPRYSGPQGRFWCYRLDSDDWSAPRKPAFPSGPELKRLGCLRTRVAALGWWDRGVSVLLRLSHLEDRGGARDSENGERRGTEATKPGAWRGRGWQESAVVLARAENFFRRIFCL